MAPKAVGARKRFTRNQRCRGHGPLLQFSAHPPAAAEATVSVGGAHGPESGECKVTPRPEPSLSRAWPHGTTLSLRIAFAQDLGTRDVARHLEQWMSLRPSLDGLRLHAAWTNG
jgi:hypothetical protein